MGLKNQAPTQHQPIEVWGKDHWSTLAYLETRWVDHGGVINVGHMRCDRRRHPAFAHVGSNKTYPTRLKGSAQIEAHDDWDCLDDFEAAGLVHVEGAAGGIPIVKFTPSGNKAAAALRAHKGNGGSFGNFEYVP